MGINDNMNSAVIQWLAKLYFRWRHQFIVNEFVPVRSGPFMGLLLNSTGSWGGHKARLLGTYELELWDVVDVIQRLNVRHVIDVGSADGYYSCGFAYKYSEMRVSAYDLSTRARCLTYYAAKVNGIHHRVSVKHFFDISKFVPNINVRELLLLDCEGYEVEIIKFDWIHKLSNVACLVECHEM